MREPLCRRSTVAAAAVAAALIACSPGPAKDSAPPTVLQHTPASGGTEVAVDAVVTIDFSEPIDPATVTDATVLLAHGGVAVSAARSTSGGRVTLAPSAPLAPGTSFAVTVTPGVRDLAGNALAAQQTWSFATVVPLDVTATSPVDLATGAPVNGAITATFSRPLDPATVNAATFYLTSGATRVAGAAVASGANAVLSPASPLAYSTPYTAHLAAGIRSPSGNPLAQERTWSFTTGALPDTTPPAVARRFPAPGATDIPIVARLSVAFTEPVDPTTLTGSAVTLTQGATQIPAGLGVSVGGVVLVPSALLLPGRTYVVTVGGSVKDLAGNAMGADTTWSFTTASPPAVPASVTVTHLAAPNRSAATPGEWARVQWTHPGGATGFRVEVAWDGATFVEWGTTSGAARDFGALVNSGTCKPVSFRVVALGSASVAGDSMPSAIATTALDNTALTLTVPATASTSVPVTIEGGCSWAGPTLGFLCSDILVQESIGPGFATVAASKATGLQSGLTSQSLAFAETANGQRCFRAAGNPKTGTPTCFTVPVCTSIGGIDTLKPTAPTGLTAAGSAGRIDLAWNAASDDVGVAAYRVEPQNGDPTWSTPLLASYQDGLGSAATRCYQVRALDAAGNVSDPSARACAATLDVSPPTAPGSVTVGASWCPVSAPTISWGASTDDVGVDHYVVFQEHSFWLLTTFYDEWHEILSVPGTTWDDPCSRWAGLDADSCYGVVAVDAAGNRSGMTTACH